MTRRDWVGRTRSLILQCSHEADQANTAGDSARVKDCLEAAWLLAGVVQDIEDTIRSEGNG